MSDIRTIGFVDLAGHFGGTVNLAARTTGQAGTGQALDTVALGTRRLRNILEPVELWAVELCPTHIDLSIDPVCRMRVSCQAAVARIRQAGTEHWLCSLDCAGAFAAEPDRYLTQGAATP